MTRLNLEAPPLGTRSLLLPRIDHTEGILHEHIYWVTLKSHCCNNCGCPQRMSSIVPTRHPMSTGHQNRSGEGLGLGLGLGLWNCWMTRLNLEAPPLGTRSLLLPRIAHTEGIPHEHITHLNNHRCKIVVEHSVCR